MSACIGRADTVRVATYNVEMSRAGPGLMLRDIASGKDPQIEKVIAVIAQVSPDILLLNGFDYDYRGIALAAFAEALSPRTPAYPHLFALRPNTGLATGLDMDGDGKLGSPRDAQGYGTFPGQGGMAVLSRLPIKTGDIQDFSAILWANFPDAMLPETEGGVFPSKEAMAAQRLSTTGHWDVPVQMPDGRILHMLAFHATPPVYDGPEDRNGRRNHDEVRFWTALLNHKLAHRPPSTFVIAGDANLDPFDGDGLHQAMRDLLAHPDIQDPMPESPGARQLGTPSRRGNPALDTVDWPKEDGPGNLRVDYVLPSGDLHISAAGVFWPSDGAGAKTVGTASRHRLVWIDIKLPD